MVTLYNSRFHRLLFDRIVIRRHDFFLGLTKNILLCKRAFYVLAVEYMLTGME
jgi:hypothetical protein